MNLLTPLRKLFCQDDGLVCPRCEKSIAGHDDKECERRMSRRYFFGVVAGAVAAAVTARMPTGTLFDPFQDLASTYNNLILRPEMLGFDKIVVLHNNTRAARLLSKSR